MLNALERLASEYGFECNRVRQDQAIAEAQLRDNRARLGKPFTLDGYMTELTALRDQLKTGLSGARREPDKEDGPSVSELAEHIKTLKTANTIEATPQRARQNHLSAEEPITARIRRRTEIVSAFDPSLKSGVTEPPKPNQDSSVAPHLMFQERIALERQSKRDGLPSPD